MGILGAGHPRASLSKCPRKASGCAAEAAIFSTCVAASGPTRESHAVLAASTSPAVGPLPHFHVSYRMVSMPDRRARGCCEHRVLGREAANRHLRPIDAGRWPPPNGSPRPPSTSRAMTRTTSTSPRRTLTAGALPSDRRALSGSRTGLLWRTHVRRIVGSVLAASCATRCSPRFLWEKDHGRH